MKDFIGGSTQGGVAFCLRKHTKTSIPRADTQRRSSHRWFAGMSDVFEKKKKGLCDAAPILNRGTVNGGHATGGLKRLEKGGSRSGDGRARHGRTGIARKKVREEVCITLLVFCREKSRSNVCQNAKIGRIIPTGNRLGA